MPAGKRGVGRLVLQIVRHVREQRLLGTQLLGHVHGLVRLKCVACGCGRRASRISTSRPLSTDQLSGGISLVSVQ